MLSYAAIRRAWSWYLVYGREGVDLPVPLWLVEVANALIGILFPLASSLAYYKYAAWSSHGGPPFPRGGARKEHRWSGPGSGPTSNGLHQYSAFQPSCPKHLRMVANRSDKVEGPQWVSQRELDFMRVRIREDLAAQGMDTENLVVDLSVIPGKRIRSPGLVLSPSLAMWAKHVGACDSPRRVMRV